MPIINAAAVALSATLLIMSPPSTKTQVEKDAIVAQGVAQDQARIAGLRAEMDAANAELRAAPPCFEDASAIEALALTGKEALIGEAVRTFLPPRCDPGETSEWRLVQRAHFQFLDRVSNGAAGGASGMSLAVGFPSLVSCYRAGQEIRARLSDPYETREACVHAHTGTFVPID